MFVDVHGNEHYRNVPRSKLTEKKIAHLREILEPAHQRGNPLFRLEVRANINVKEQK